MIKEIIINYKEQIPVPCEWEPENDQILTLKKLCYYAGEHGYKPSQDAYGAFIEAANQKLALNSKPTKTS